MTSSDDIQAWDRAAAAYSNVAGTQADSTYQRFEGFLWHHLGDNLDGLRLLDLGCGHGWLAELCRTRGAIVTAVDGSDELLSIARSRYPEVYFQQGDLTEGLPEAWRLRPSIAWWPTWFLWTFPTSMPWRPRSGTA